VFGKKDTYSIELSDISSGIGGFVIIGELADDKSGYSVSSAGDVNGDGLDDLIVGAYQATPRDKSSTGRTSIPPLPVRISLPAPATKISSLVVPVRILSFLSPR
jgi:hypothetical protein